MKILVAIPFLFGAEHSRLCIESIIDSDVDLLLIDNGAAQDVKNVLNHYHSRKNVVIKSFPENIFVNPAWNYAMEFFRATDHDYLIIMNSDLIMQKDWFEVLKNRLIENPNEITLPIISDGLFYVNPNYQIGQEVTSGTPGVFILMNWKQVEMVYPIPSEIKVWFGDQFIFTVLRELGFKTVIAPNLYAQHYHNGSQNVSRVAGISELIEADKLAWANEVENIVREKIKKSNYH